MSEKETRQVLLEQLHLFVLKRLGEEFGIPATVEIRAGMIADGLYLSIKQRIWAQKMVTVKLPWPEDWWQAFKERWFPRWLKVRFPVEYAQHSLDIHALYPKLAFPETDIFARIALWNANEERQEMLVPRVAAQGEPFVDPLTPLGRAMMDPGFML